MSASDRLIIPFSADGSCKRAVRAVVSLLYGITRVSGAQQSEFFLNTDEFRMTTPKIYCYVGNRLTQYLATAKAFTSVVNEIGKEIWAVWNSNPNSFAVHPSGNGVPRTQAEFRRMFQAEIADANSASVVSGALGIPISRLSPGAVTLLRESIMVNQTQIDRQQPNIRKFVQTIE
jgi:chromosome partitioning protein